MLILTIDPGLNQLGFSVWVHGKLWDARLLVYETRGAIAQRCRAIAAELVRVLQSVGYTYFDRIVIEDQIYRGKFRNSVRKLAQAADAIARALSRAFNYALSEVVWRLPEAWKGNMSKISCEKHVLRMLSEEEKSRIRAPALDKDFRLRTAKEKKDVSDVMDAVGIGLHAVGRF